MDYDLLKIKASQIPNNNGVGKLSYRKLAGGKMYVMPSLSFNCSGIVTGFFVGVDFRVDNNRNGTPWVGLFNYNINESTYTVVSDSKRFFTLNAINFSTSGLIQYEFDEPLHFEKDQLLGVYQPNNSDRKVTLFYHDSTEQHIYILTSKWPPQYSDSSVLFYPIMPS